MDDPRWLIAVGVGAAVLALSVAGARRPSIPRAEAKVFRAINGLPDWLFPVLWVPMQLGNLAVGTGADALPVAVGPATVAEAVGGPPPWDVGVAEATDGCVGVGVWPGPPPLWVAVATRVREAVGLADPTVGDGPKVGVAEGVTDPSGGVSVGVAEPLSPSLGAT